MSGGSGAASIAVRNLRKVYDTRFGQKTVLDGVSFDLAMGERLGVLGRNGAGKSTMVRLISGAERPSGGTIRRGMSVSWPLAFGGAFQPNLTGIDNIRFITSIYAQDFDRNLAFVKDFAELGPYLREPVRTYSSGMRARLAFAISMIIEFDCFLIDEIGAVGDARFHERCNSELFDKRGDRAMIVISHDAAYVREHCNRFAVLNDAKLDLFTNFDVAYEHFRRTIGVAPLASTAPTHGQPSDRSRLIHMAQMEARADDAFGLLVRDADRLRDARDWEAAQAAYADALALHPFERSYWTQHGHMAKEREAYERAEISYRTALAHGEPLQDIVEHLEFVIARQGLSAQDAPIHTYRPGAGARQVPGAADLELFARLLWGRDDPPRHDMATLLRTMDSCDALFAAMVADDRHDGASMDNVTYDGRPPDWVAHLCCILAPSDRGRSAERIMSRLENAKSLLPAILDAGGLADWPLSVAALTDRE